MDSLFKYGIVKNGKLYDAETNQEIKDFLERNEGKIICFQFNEIGEDLPHRRRYAYFHGYIVPAFVKLMNDERTRFPTVTIETKITVEDFLKRLFIGEDENGNALSLKHISNERFMPDFINPIIAFAAIIFNAQLEPPTHNWKQKQFNIKYKKIIL